MKWSVQHRQGNSGQRRHLRFLLVTRRSLPRLGESDMGNLRLRLNIGSLRPSTASCRYARRVHRSRRTRSRRCGDHPWSSRELDKRDAELMRTCVGLVLTARVPNHTCRQDRRCEPLGFQPVAIRPGAFAWQRPSNRPCHFSYFSVDGFSAFTRASDDQRHHADPQVVHAFSASCEQDGETDVPQLLRRPVHS